MKLIIVESPAKARTIEKFLGAGYKVAASYGHIRDLPSSAKEIPVKYRDKPWARLGVNTEGDFVPLYVVSQENKKRVAELKRLIKTADELLLATDEDREGEAISWHLLEVLKPDIPVRRITFHEITKSAIAEALANPREVNHRLVRAQESRRILDRLYGYSLSPVLWKKVRTKLSAGRVQSVAVRLIVEREEERRAFRLAEYWAVEATLTAGNLTFPARLVALGGQKLATGKDFDPENGKLKEKVKALVLDESAAVRIAEGVARPPWQVTRLERKETRQRPSPPFITSTLQQAASAQLGFSPKQTMLHAQHLYEGVDLGSSAREGLITYMRTDSVNLSEKALRETADLILDKFGESYTQGPRRYRTKVKGAQEAHEAIRPTDVRRTPEEAASFLNKSELALYRLIWNRTVASQMTDAQLDKTTVDFSVPFEDQVPLFRANGSVVRFAGYLKVYDGSQQDTVLPDLQEGQAINRPEDRAEGAETGRVAVAGCEPRKHETTPPARFTEAALVRKLEEEGIGRPSTYAPIISTIQARGYVVKKGKALLPTYVGMAVVELLRRHFAQYVDLKFTAKMEGDLDEIAAGQVDGVHFLAGFYRGNGGDATGLLEHIDRELPTIEFPAIFLGNDSESGEPVTVRIGRTFVYVQRGEGDEAKRAPVPVDLLIDDLNLEKALSLIADRARGEEPLGVDPQTGQKIYVLTGPYGPYVQLGEKVDKKKPKRVALPRGRKIEEVDLSYALRLLSLPRVLGDDPDTGQEVIAGLGRFGPFVHRGGIFASLGGEEQLFSVTLEEALTRIQAKSKKILIKELGTHPETGSPLQVMKGRYGPYVTDGKVNANLGRVADPAKVTLEQAVDLLAEATTKKKTGPKKKTAKKKVTPKKSPKKKTTQKKSAKKKVAKKAGSTTTGDKKIAKGGTKTTRKKVPKKAPTKKTANQ